MKRFLLTITIFSILAILPLAIFAQSAEKPFAGCEFIVEDAACSQYLGKTQAEIESLIGKPDEGRGDYYRIGTWFLFAEHKKDNAYRASEILFYGKLENSDYKPFAGKPAKNLNWNAKMDEVIKKYGNPASQVTFDNGNRVTLKYGRVEFQFTDKRLTSIRLNDVAGEELRQIANKQLEDQKLQNALSDCKFILDDNGCGKYFGKSAKEITELFGKQLENNNYPDLGLFFRIWGDSNNGVPDTVAEVTFYNDGKHVKQFYGQPGENLGWNATRDDVIKQYGKPTEENSWVESDKIPRSSLYYGENLRIKIENNRITEITIISPKHNQNLEAYYRRMEEDKNRRDKEFANMLAKQRELAKQGNETTSNVGSPSQSSPPDIPYAIRSDFDLTERRVKILLTEANRIVAKFNKNQLVYESLGWRYRMEKEVYELRKRADNLRREFIEKHKDKLTKEMLDYMIKEFNKSN